jgi:hypothetical protein
MTRIATPPLLPVPAKKLRILPISVPTGTPVFPNLETSKWIDSVKQEVGFDKESVMKELRKRLGI